MQNNNYIHTQGLYTIIKPHKFQWLNQIWVSLATMHHMSYIIINPLKKNPFNITLIANKADVCLQYSHLRIKSWGDYEVQRHF